jgi:site-specific DNA recombinase
VRTFLIDAPRLSVELADVLSSDQQQIAISEAATLADQMRLSSQMTKSMWSRLRSFLHRVEIGPKTLICTISRNELLSALTDGLPRDIDASDEQRQPQLITLLTPLEMKRRGQEARIVLASSATTNFKLDPVLADLVARAHLYLDLLIKQPGTAVAAVAEQHRIHPAEVGRILPLAFLAPSITEAILTGRQPADLTGRPLARLDLPMSWQDQRQILSA